jgi:hypothetical protein
MIVIPMAGLSRRFVEAGYDRPKYMLEAGGVSLFAHSIRSFAHYFRSERFLFVCRDLFSTAAFVEVECRRMGIRDYAVIKLTAPTRGQADTVHIGLERAQAPDGDAVTIFNIDTIRPEFRFPQSKSTVRADGFLEVFRDTGSNWSFVCPENKNSDRVAQTTEKIPISDLACTGLYHFRRAGFFRDAFRAAAAAPFRGELYVAPLYNHLISHAYDIRYVLISRDDVVFSGVPAEYETFKARAAQSA